MASIDNGCIDKVAEYADKAFGKNVLNKIQIGQLIKRIRRESKIIMDNGGKTEEEAISEASGKIFERAKQSIEFSKKRFAKTAIRVNQINASWDRLSDPADIVNTVNKSLSHDNTVNTLLNSTYGKTTGLIKQLKDENLLDYARNPKNEFAIGEQIWSKNYDDSLNGKVAKIFNNFNSDVVQIMRDTGVNVEEIDNYMGFQRHDDNKILEVPNYIYRRLRGLNRKVTREEREEFARKRWVDFQLQKLDLQKTFPEANNNIETYRDELEKDWNERAQRSVGIFDSSEQVVKASKFSSRIAGKPRTYQYKDSASWLDYQKQYGGGSLYQNMIDHVNDVSRKLEVMKFYGPDPEYTHNRMLAKLKQFNDDNVGSFKGEIEGGKKYSKAKQELEQLYRFSTGQVAGDRSTSLAGLKSFFSLLVTFSRAGNLLPKILFKDTATLMTQNRTINGQTFTGSLLNTMSALKSFVNKKDLKQAYEEAGFSFEAIPGATFNPFDSLQNPESKVGKVISGYYAANLVTRWDKVARATFAVGQMRQFWNLKNLSFDDLPPGIKGTMNVYGMANDEWDLLRKNAVTLKRKKILSPESILNIPDEEILNYASKNKLLKKGDKSTQSIDFIRNDLYYSLRRMIADQGNYIIFHPDALLRAQKNEYLSGKSPVSKLMAHIFLQMKGFQLATYNRLWKPMLGSNFTGSQKALNIASVIAANAAFSYLGYSIKQLAEENRTPQLPWGQDGLSLNKSIDMMAPPMGMLGEMIKTAALNPDELGSSLEGPAAGSVVDFAKWMNSMFSSEKNWTQRHQTKWQITKKFAEKDLNPAKLPYLISAWNWYINYALNPESYNQQQNKLDNKTHTQRIFDPGA